jgi:hypothetical protein
MQCIPKVQNNMDYNHNQKPERKDLDFYFEFGFKLSPKLKEYLATFVKVGKTTIPISHIFIPILANWSIAITPVETLPSNPPPNPIEKAQ